MGNSGGNILQKCWITQSQQGHRKQTLTEQNGQTKIEIHKTRPRKNHNEIINTHNKCMFLCLSVFCVEELIYHKPPDPEGYPRKGAASKVFLTEVLRAIFFCMSLMRIRVYARSHPGCLLKCTSFTKRVLVVVEAWADSRRSTTGAKIKQCRGFACHQASTSIR